MSEIRLVNTVIPSVSFVVLSNYLLLMRTAQRIQIQLEVDFKISTVRFIRTMQKARNIAKFSPKDYSEMDFFFPILYYRLKSEVILKRKIKLLHMRENIAVL